MFGTLIHAIFYSYKDVSMTEQTPKKILITILVLRIKNLSESQPRCQVNRTRVTTNIPMSPVVLSINSNLYFLLCVSFELVT